MDKQGGDWMVTHQRATNKLAESYRMDLKESIELAKEGMLSPSEQEYGAPIHSGRCSVLEGIVCA